MEQFFLSTDSTCDLFQDYVKANRIWFVPLTFMVEKDGKIEERLDQFTDYSQYVDFYNELRGGALSKTAMLNYDAHYNHFLKMAQAGAKDVVHFTISSGLSPTKTVAAKAAAEVKKEYPKFEVYVVDPLTATVGQGALPSGLKGRVYSFEEPAADEGDRMELTARLQTEIENDDRSRNIFFYAFTEEGTLRRTQKHQTVRGRMLAAADSLYDAGYINNGMMTMPAMALILLGCVIWVHRAYLHKD